MKYEICKYVTIELDALKKQNIVGSKIAVSNMQDGNGVHGVPGFDCIHSPFGVNFTII